MNKQILNIQDIQRNIEKGNIYWTKHCLNKINQRNILIIDVKNVIKNGKIIEFYYEDYPYPSCLILGKDRYNREVHVVCGNTNNVVYMITAYYPNLNKWESDMKTRRKK